MLIKLANLIMVAALGLVSANAFAGVRGHIAPEYTHFFEEGAQGQERFFGSASIQVEAWTATQNDQNFFSFRGFSRYDSKDSARSHSDIRELTWLHVGEGWETRLGIGKVFWGVTEAMHLVDIVNQTDLVENIDGSEKLGQPMLSVGLEEGDHKLDVFLLVGSRARTFPGPSGRLRLPVVIDTETSLWESSNRSSQVDSAIRWQWQGDRLLTAISGFQGNGREPIYQLSNTSIEPLLIPYYPTIRQAGLELQSNMGDWIWKFEGLYREGQHQNYHAFDAGFEYNQVGLFDSQVDLTWYAEWLYDSRGYNPLNPFENDIFLGWRFDFNDMFSSNVMFSVIVDPDSYEQFWNITAERRLGDRWTVRIENRIVANTAEPQVTQDYLLNRDEVHALSPWARDSHLRMEFFYYF